MSKLGVAIEYIRRMAAGNNPVNNQPVSEDTVLNDINVVRCLYYVAEVLQMVQEGELKQNTSRKGSKKTEFPYEELKEFKFECNKSITHVIKQINDLVDTKIYKRITIKTVKESLITRGFLIEKLDEGTGKKRTCVTDDGRKLGIYVEQRISFNGSEYSALMYDANAQRYIVDNLKEMINGK